MKKYIEKLIGQELQCMRLNYDYPDSSIQVHDPAAPIQIKDGKCYASKNRFTVDKGELYEMLKNDKEALNEFYSLVCNAQENYVLIQELKKEITLLKGKL